MSDKEIVLNSVLCYTIGSLRKHPVKIVKSVLTDFYNVDTISNAKDRLSSDITKSGLNIKIPPNRRADNKRKLDIDDVLNLLQAVDVMKAFDKLPIYACNDIYELPVMNLDAGGLSVILTKLDNIGEQLSSCQLNTGCNLHNPHAGNSVRPSAPDDDQLPDHVMHWGSTSSDAFIEVNNKNIKKRRIASNPSPSSDPSNTIQSQSTAHPSQSYAGAVRDHTTPRAATQTRSKRIIGRGETNQLQTKLKSAKPYMKKAVYGLYNVCSDETVDTVSDSISQITGGKPITCFQIQKKSNTRSDSISFRVCIDDEFSKKFLDASAWPNGIVIRPWRFKPKVIESKQGDPALPQDGELTR